MENYNVYEDIATRTNGDIYIGVVGPVRTGKSTFIKRFMEKMVIPYAEDADKNLMIDELPQSASGRTVMTTEPKLVPAKSAKITVKEKATANVRLVDCVGFPVDGATGFEENGSPRLVKTPWSETAMPFDEAASFGTQKVIKDHATIGILITTDGSITDIQRENYVAAEERTVAELKLIGKPFVIVLNCVNPDSASSLADSLEKKYGVPVMPTNVDKMPKTKLTDILQKVLFEFPVTQIDVKMPDWMQALPLTSSLTGKIVEGIRSVAPKLNKMKDCLRLNETNLLGGDVSISEEAEMELGNGKITLNLKAREGLFYDVLTDECGEAILDDFSLMRYIESLADSKRNYDKIKDAFLRAQEDGYGMVAPSLEEMQLDEPKLVKKGGAYGVHFKASAPSYHILKIDVSGAVNPIVGDKKQGEEFVRETVGAFETNDNSIWETNIFGKSLKDLMGDGLQKKTEGMPENVQKKMRKAITKIVNEGKGGVLCILL